MQPRLISLVFTMLLPSRCLTPAPGNEPLQKTTPVNEAADDQTIARAPEEAQWEFDNEAAEAAKMFVISGTDAEVCSSLAIVAASKSDLLQTVVHFSRFASEQAEREAVRKLEGIDLSEKISICVFIGRSHTSRGLGLRSVETVDGVTTVKLADLVCQMAERPTIPKPWCVLLIPKEATRIRVICARSSDPSGKEVWKEIDVFARSPVPDR